MLNRLSAIKNILNAIPKDGNPSNSAAMLNKLWKGKVGTLMGAAMGAGGHGTLAGGVLGGIADHTLGEIKPYLAYKILEMRGAGKNIVPSNVKALVDYAKSVSQGHGAIEKAVNGIFNQSTIMSDSKIPGENDRKRLDGYLTKVQNNPNLLTGTAPGLQDTAPDHASSLSLTASNAANYMNGIKPRASLGLPMDSKIKPNQMQTSEYNRQLDVAQQPMMVLKHIQDGTLTPKDMITLQNTSPGAYQMFREKMLTQLASPDAKTLSYKTRLSMSLFLGQPLDSTMTPAAIIGAQPMPQPGPAPAPQRGPRKPPSKASTAPLNKLSQQYSTPGQAAEGRRANKD